MNNTRDDFTGGNSTVFSTLTGVLIGVALMTLLDRDKRRSVINTARDIKNKAVDTTDEIKNDLVDMKDSAVESAQNLKDDVKNKVNNHR